MEARSLCCSSSLDSHTFEAEYLSPRRVSRNRSSVSDQLGERMAEQLHQYARVHEIVPVESWRKDGVEGWLFRDRENQTIFVETSKLLGHQLTFEVN